MRNSLLLVVCASLFAGLLAGGSVFLYERNQSSKATADLQSQINGLENQIAAKASLKIADVTALKVGDHVGFSLTVASITAAPGQSGPVSNTNYAITFSGTTVSTASILVGDTDGTPVYSLDSNNAQLWENLPVINGVLPGPEQSLVGPDATFSMQNAFGTYNKDYSAGSVLTATFTIGGLEYDYNGSLHIDMALLSATNSGIQKP